MGGLWSVWIEPEDESGVGESAAPAGESEDATSGAPAVESEDATSGAPAAESAVGESGALAVDSGDATPGAPVAAPGGSLAGWHCLANRPGSRHRAESAVPVPAPAASPQEIEL